LELISSTAERPGLTIAPSASYNPHAPRVIGDFPELRVFSKPQMFTAQNRAAGRVSTGGHPRHPPSGIYRALPLLSFLAWQKTGPALKSGIRRDR
jgi:hypothetical protein